MKGRCSVQIHIVFAGILLLGIVSSAQTREVNRFTPVTQEMLANPSPDDWLMYSRTYDAQRFSPLKQITPTECRPASPGLQERAGRRATQESIPIVLPRRPCTWSLPGASVLAVDATTGATIWEHKRPSGASRTKALAIYDDMIFYSSPDGFIVALDARTGAGEVGNEVERQPDVRRRLSPTAR